MIFDDTMHDLINGINKCKIQFLLLSCNKHDIWSHNCKKWSIKCIIVTQTFSIDALTIARATLLVFITTFHIHRVNNM
jgi:hypothetical protein